MTDAREIIQIRKSRIAEATRQAAAECVYDIRMCLAERGFTLEGELRQLFLDTIHTKMTLSMLDELQAANYDFQDG